MSIKKALVISQSQCTINNTIMCHFSSATFLSVHEFLLEIRYTVLIASRHLAQ